MPICYNLNKNASQFLWIQMNLNTRNSFLYMEPFSITILFFAVYFMISLSTNPCKTFLSPRTLESLMKRETTESLQLLIFKTSNRCCQGKKVKKKKSLQSLLLCCEFSLLSHIWYLRFFYFFLLKVKHATSQFLVPLSYFGGQHFQDNIKNDRRETEENCSTKCQFMLFFCFHSCAFLRYLNLMDVFI